MQEHAMIPLNSALRLRDAAIRYGALKLAQAASLVVVLAAALASLIAWQLQMPTLLWSAATAGLIGFVVSGFFARRLEFPHFPRVAEEELEEMREMGIPAAVVKRTEESVLVGSLAELEAMQKTRALIAQFVGRQPDNS